MSVLDRGNYEATIIEAPYRIFNTVASRTATDYSRLGFYTLDEAQAACDALNEAFIQERRTFRVAKLELV